MLFQWTNTKKCFFTHIEKNIELGQRFLTLASVTSHTYKNSKNKLCFHQFRWYFFDITYVLFVLWFLHRNLADSMCDNENVQMMCLLMMMTYDVVLCGSNLIRRSYKWSYGSNNRMHHTIFIYLELRANWQLCHIRLLV